MICRFMEDHPGSTVMSVVALRAVKMSSSLSPASITMKRGYDEM